MTSSISSSSWCKESSRIDAGAVLEGFLRFPEATQDFPSTMGAPLFGYNISRGIHSRLTSGVNWPLFRLEVKEM